MEKQETTMSQNNTTAKKLKNSKKPLYIIGGTAGAALLVLASVLIYHKVHYANRWYKNTYINGINVTNETLEDSKKLLNKKLENYSMEVRGRDNARLMIDGKNISYNANVTSDLDKIFDKEHESFSLFAKKREFTTNYDIKYDKNALKKIVNSSEMIKGSDNYKIVKPVSATVKFSEDKQQFECVKEQPGNKIVKYEFLNILDGAMKKGITTLNINNEKKYPNVYKHPKYTSKDDILQKELKICNKTALRYITWDMGKGVKEQITPALISQWISCKNGQLRLKSQLLEEWVEKFCLKYKTVGKQRTFKSHTGKMVSVAGGDYGWQIDYVKTVAQTKAAIKKALDPSAIENYIKDPSNEDNIKAITLNKKVIYKNTAFQKDYENFAVDWDTKNYTEVDLAAQEVYVFRNGKVVYTTHCISGLPVPGRQTCTGVYFIKEHRADYVMKGADYTTKTKNWVRITWSGTGFHPAPWQNWSSWSPTVYQRKGSHGCLNLPIDSAKKIFDLVKYREAVFMHN